MLNNFDLARGTTSPVAIATSSTLATNAHTNAEKIRATIIHAANRQVGSGWRARSESSGLTDAFLQRVAMRSPTKDRYPLWLMILPTR